MLTVVNLLMTDIARDLWIYGDVSTPYDFFAIRSPLTLDIGQFRDLYPPRKQWVAVSVTAWWRSWLTSGQTGGRCSYLLSFYLFFISKGRKNLWAPSILVISWVPPCSLHSVVLRSLYWCSFILRSTHWFISFSRVQSVILDLSWPGPLIPNKSGYIQLTIQTWRIGRASPFFVQRKHPWFRIPGMKPWSWVFSGFSSHGSDLAWFVYWIALAFFFIRGLWTLLRIGCLEKRYSSLSL